MIHHHAQSLFGYDSDVDVLVLQIWNARSLLILSDRLQSSVDCMVEKSHAGYVFTSYHKL